MIWIPKSTTRAPYTQNANAVLERTDELIGDLLVALPSGYTFALVSDHGFERVDQTANPRVLLAQKKITGNIAPLDGIVTTTEPTVAAFLRHAAADPANGIGPEISKSELLQYAPQLKDVAAAFQPADHVMFGPADKGAYFTPPHEKGNHGFWPNRHDYRSVFLLRGPGIQSGSIGEIQLITIAGQLAAALGLLL